MKKTFLIYLIISVLLISLIFSCKTDGPDSNNTEGGSKEVPSPIEIAVKKLKEGSNYITKASHTAKDAASKSNATDSPVNEYTVAAKLKFEYDKDTKKITVTEESSDTSNNKLGKFKLATKEELQKLITAIKNGVSDTETTVANKAKGQFKAEIEVNKPSSSDSGEKTITILKGKTGANANKRFFDLGEDSHITDTTALSGVTGVFSYMIEDKSTAQQTLQEFKNKIDKYEKN